MVLANRRGGRGSPRGPRRSLLGFSGGGAARDGWSRENHLAVLRSWEKRHASPRAHVPRVKSKQIPEFLT